MAEWMIKRNEREAGPFSSQVVLQNIKNGIIHKTDLIRKKGQPKWGTCSQLQGVTFPEQIDHIIFLQSQIFLLNLLLFF